LLVEWASALLDRIETKSPTKRIAAKTAPASQT
jgi:hypothetical protein